MGNPKKLKWITQQLKKKKTLIELELEVRNIRRGEQDSTIQNKDDDVRHDDDVHLFPGSGNYPKFIPDRAWSNTPYYISE